MAECNAVDFIEMVCVVDQDNDCVPTFQLFRFKTFRDRIERFLILKALLALEPADGMHEQRDHKRIDLERVAFVAPDKDDFRGFFDVAF